MGGWKLEVFKMAVYMSFPVSLFYYFNQPEFFEDWMMSKRKQLFPPQDKNAKAIIEKTIEKIEKQQEEQWLKNK